MDLGFIAKKIVGSVVMPLPLFLVMIIVGFCFLWCQQRKLGLAVSVAALVVLLIFSLPITSRYLIWSIEFEHPKLALETETDIAQLQALSPAHIVVLGCWHNDDDALPLVAKIHPCSLPRIVHAVKIWRLIPDSKLLFSGNAGLNGGEAHPLINARLAKDLGVPDSQITTVIGAKDTEQGIRLYKSHIENEPFIVVSSATHMKRIKYLFNQYGLDPILAPAEYVSAHGYFSWQLLIPNAESLYQSERAIYEVLGNIWVRLKSLF